MKISTAALVITLAGLCSAQYQELCHSTDPNPYLKLGTKTPYEFVKGRTSYTDNYVPNCDPVLFWSLNRNGVTYLNADKARDLPSLIDVRNQIVKNYEQAHTAPQQGRLCQADIQNLKYWVWNQTDPRAAGMLTDQGSWDTANLAKSWRSKFPQVFDANPNNYLFLYAEDPLSRMSYKAFADGLLGSGTVGQGYTPETPNRANDRNLRPYLQCPAWERLVKNNNDTNQQIYIYKNKEEYRSMLTNISTRLGFQYPLDSMTIEKIYEMCRVNKAWEIRKPSPWCAAFTRQDLEMMEYVEDLKTYYKAGYGSTQNKELGCTMIKDFMDYFSNYINGRDQNGPKVKVQFTQSAMILMTLTALNAFETQVPLTADNYHYPLIQKRAWRTSILDPYNANLVAVLYKCRYDNVDPYKIIFFLNEQPIELSNCQVGLCSWSYVKEFYGKIADKCSLGFCSRSSGAPMHSTIPLIFMFTFFASIGFVSKY